jgi:hypothetical protein
VRVRGERLSLRLRLDVAARHVDARAPLRLTSEADDAEVGKQLEMGGELIVHVDL